MSLVQDLHHRHDQHRVRHFSQGQPQPQPQPHLHARENARGRDYDQVLSRGRGRASCPILFIPSTHDCNTKAQPLLLTVQPGATPSAKPVQYFISEVYRRAYGASIGVHYNTLMSLEDCHGRILAALGFRPASEGPLFLEQYLDQTAQDLLGVPRSQIAEIGNLASTNHVASVVLFAALSAHLHAGGFTQAMVTGTAALHEHLAQMGLRPQRHVAADPSLLLETGEDWGSYYDTQPFVLSGDILDGHGVFRALAKSSAAANSCDDRRASQLASLDRRYKGDAS